MATYHPIFSGLWNDEALEGLSFEAKGFFAFLCTNDHVRPSGIYRVTDKQLAEETGLRLRRVQEYLGALSVRHRIVRDGLWLFVCGYFKRQPKQERLLGGVRQDLADCSSQAVLEAFFHKYPLFSNPSNVMRSTEQSSSEQSRAVQSRAMQSSRPSTPEDVFVRSKKPSRPKYLEIVERMRADHPELSSQEADARALAEFQRRLTP